MRQMEVTKKKIGGRTFYIKPFGAFAAARISGQLSALIGPVIGGLAPAVNVAVKNAEENALMDTQMEDILPGISEALSAIDGDRLETMLKVLLVNNRNISVSCEETGDEVEPLTEDLANEIFCCGLDEMILLCIEVVRLNFGDFFAKMTGRFGSLSEVGAMVMTKSANGES